MHQQKSSPLVSVVVCTYNGEKYLTEQLSSLESQSYKNIEFICSDNNSTDSTKQILINWCKKQETRNFFTCEELGLNKNFYSAISKASGEYIMFSDQDDIWLSDKVEKLVTFHEENPDASMVYCLSKEFSGLEQPGYSAKKSGSNYLEGTDIRKTMLTSFTLGHNICIKRDILLKLTPSPDETVAYDWWITVSAMCLGPIKCLPEVLTLWRKHKSNITHEINQGLFFKTRISYLTRFGKTKFITPQQKQWIQHAISCFSELHYRKFSFTLFLFFLSNAKLVFFYKRKRNYVTKWLSFAKWSYRMSYQKFEVIK